MGARRIVVNAVVRSLAACSSYATKLSGNAGTRGRSTAAAVNIHKRNKTIRTLRWTFALGLMSSACLDVPAADDEPSQATQAINGPSAPASAFQLARGVKLPGCTATKISARFAITARHCGSRVGDTVFFYGAGPGIDEARSAQIDAVFARPGTTIAGCQDSPSSCIDTTGQFADVAVIRLTNEVSATLDSLAGGQATLAWRYPGENVAGTQVGAGKHEGNPNDGGTLLQVNDTLDSASDSDSSFQTTTDFVDPGDSGGPFYVGGRILGTLWGHGWDLTEGYYSLYTSVPRHLDFILTSMGYHWIGQPSQANRAYAGTVIEAFAATEQVCQYACEHTASCQAYNVSATQTCSLVSNVVGSSFALGSHAALHYGASSSTSNDVIGYVRGDGFNAVLHKASNGQLHELFRNASTWSHGTIAPAGMPTIASKLSGYRRADGINAVVYRSAANHIIELALVNGAWIQGDLTAAAGSAAAVGDPAAYVRGDGVSAIVFRAANGHINELRLTAAGWAATNLTAAAGSAIVASSDPSAFVRSDGLSSVVFRAGSDIIELFKATGGSWGVGGPSSLASAPAAASRPHGYNHHDGITAIVYRSTANRVIELWLDGAGWHFGDITGVGLAAAGDPVAYVRSDAVESVAYRSTSNLLMELTNNPWQSINQSAIAGTSALTTDPAVYVRTDGLSATVYGLASNHVGELSLQIGASGSVAGDLTTQSGETP